MTSRSGHGDLLLAAIVISLVAHALLMFFAAPHVMSRTVNSALEVKRSRHPPMAVKRFDGDPLREHRKTEPKMDVPAPREAPTVASVGGAVPAAADSSERAIPVDLPSIAMPEVLSGPADAVMELPKPSVPDVANVETGPEAGFSMPMSAPAAPSVSDGIAPAPSGAEESFIPTPGAVAPEPVFTLNDVSIGETKAETAMAGIEPANSAPKVDYVFDNKVLDTVNEGFVEKEKAAVRELLAVPDAAPAESAVNCRFAACIDPADPKWRYFKVTFTPKTGVDSLPVVPKDMVILIDASGSIGKDRLRNCRNVAKSILRSCLNSGDRFNLVAFRNSFSYAFREWRECDAPSFEAADGWLSKLTAHGRTDVFSVIRSVLTLPRDPTRPLIALVVTDGDANAGISDTAEILSRFTKLNDGLVSVYMYGVKKEANRELIELLTRGNRGESFIHTGFRWLSGDNLEQLAKAFRDPILTDLRLVFAAGSEAEVYPRLLKNLYRGGRVELCGRCPAQVKSLVFTLKGLSGAKAFESLYKLDFASAQPSSQSLPAEWREGRNVAGRLKQ